METLHIIGHFTFHFLWALFTVIGLYHIGCVLLKKIKAAYERSQYKAGVKFAQAELTSRGKEAEEELSGYIEAARTFDSYDSFDQGIQEALNRWWGLQK